MTTTIKTKWFYKYIDAIRQRVEAANYSFYGYCHYQIIDDGKYIECWDVQNNETQKIEQIVAVANKHTDFIFFYSSDSGNKF